MQILFKITDINEYLKKGKDFNWPKPWKKCVRCKEYCKIFKHGFYQRCYVNPHLKINELIYIKRYFCTNCLKTISLLPSFCISKFVVGFDNIFKAVYSILNRKKSIEKAVDKLNLEFEYISKQQYYNYLNRFYKNITLIESFIRQRNIEAVFGCKNCSKNERVRDLLEHIKKESNQLNHFLYEFYQSTNKLPITLFK